MDLKKYTRQISLNFIGEENQKKLLNKTVLIIGLGGTGSAIADLISRSGIKKLILIDRDKIEITNIHRQILYDYYDIGKYKAETACKKIKNINPDIDLEYYNETFDASKINLIKHVDLVFDGTDNMLTRFIINDACNKFNTPWVFTSANEVYGEIKAIIPNKTSCYACYNKEPTELPSCAVTGVLSTLPNVIGSFAVNLGIKILLGYDVSGDLHFFDVINFEVRKIKINKNEKCISCSLKNYKYLTNYYSNLGKSILS